jgi:hypothetical protein
MLPRLLPFQVDDAAGDFAVVAEVVVGAEAVIAVGKGIPHATLEVLAHGAHRVA